MIFFIALLFFVLTYVVVKFLLEKVPAIASLADILALIAGILVALWKIGAI